jgi:cellulose synthase/poly-beta-1,6-N-acetylglucosamine synthase-like glycosyltransferase
VSGWIDLTLFSLACLLLVPILVFCLECTLALPPRRFRQTADAQSPPRTSARPRVAVLIPAHNEEAGILSTVRAVKGQLRATDRLIVIADNCTDGTASLAQGAGCEVICRYDPARRGKGYALDAGVRHLENAGARPEIVIVFDADCIPQHGCVTALATAVSESGRPVQGTYLMGLPPPPSPAGATVSALAVLVKNLVRPRGLSRVGLPCMLTGTGMAFPWDVIRKAKLSSGSIVEDMQLGIDLALAGQPAAFCEEARVIGRLPAGSAAARNQRRRWEHGHLAMLISQAPRLLFRGLLARRWLALVLLADLCVPPMSLLMILTAFAACAATAAAMLGIASPMPAILLSGALGWVTLCVIGSWLRFGRQAMPPASVLGAPRYALAKMPLYASFFRNRQRQWVRTERDPAPANVKLKKQSPAA